MTEKFTCLCCGYKTLTERPNGTYEICEVCFWEDDLVQSNDPDYEGGANKVSLRQGQQNFKTFGACEIDLVNNVRKPADNEALDNNWKYLDK